jgi:CheY-like chemotaxis protein
VLVVEDQPDIAQTWVWLLQGLGHEVETACDGPTALRAAEVRHPDVVLLDLGLPGMSGYEVAAQLRQIKASPRPVLIAVTGFGEDAHRLRSYEVGVDLHLVKPVNTGELKTFLERFQTVRAGA